MEDKIHKAQPVAERLGTTVGTLAYWRYMGKGPRFIKLGRAVRYRESDVNAWLDAQTRERTGERANV